MEFMTQLGSNFGIGLTIVLAFLFALTVVVFFHELGHFVVARWCGVGIKAFSIGFGPELMGWDDKHGTRWKVAAIPLGGYVLFEDDANAASMPGKKTDKEMTAEERRRAFQLKPLWQRTAVVAAGPIANFLLAIVIFACMFMTMGVTTLEPRVGEVQPGSPAAEAGFQSGDLVLSIDGTEIDDFMDLQRIVSINVGRELAFVIDRDGQAMTLKAAPKLKELDDKIAGKHSRPVIGIKASATAETLKTEPVGPITAIKLGIERTGSIIVQTLTYLGDIIFGRQSADQVGGILRIADVAGKVAAEDLRLLIGFTAFISVSIGLINLFPIPVLDGGHLMFYAIEALRGRPLSDNAQEYAFRVGFAIIIMLMIFTFYNDRAIPAKWFSWLS